MMGYLEEYFNLFYNAYFKRKKRYVHKINSLKNRHHFGECIEYIEKSKGKNSAVFSYIREIFRLIQIGTSPILAGLFEESSF